MIAANFRKFPQAAALQLVLQFGRPVWNTSRPSTRIGRALRQAQAAAVKATPQLVAWVKTRTPEWFKKAKRLAKQLSDQVRAALCPIVWDMSAEKAEKTPRTIKRVSWAVVELLDEYEEIHHGNQARTITSTLKQKSGAWFHIPSGMTLRGASRRQTRMAWACMDA